MAEKHKSLAEHREELIARSTIQRDQLVALITDVWQPGALLTGKNILMQARQKPLLASIMAVLAVLFFRRRRLFSLLAVAAMTLQAWSQLSPYVRPFLIKLKQFSQKKLRQG